MAEEEKLRAYLKRAVAETREARQRLWDVEGRQREPVAVVGLGCRYPGAVTSAEDLWELIAAGRDAIGPIPTDRGWDLSRANGATEGGFLTDAAGFDADFFGISPREALAMDPQQRVALEVAWEALEHAGIAPGSLDDTPAGVFLGVISQEYAPRAHEAPESVAGHVVTGNTLSVASGRISYQLGLTGPALSIDTACSSSLVALHLACESLRRGESTLALAGGVTVMASPSAFIELGRQGASAHGGRCRSFAAAADGSGWSEGAGVLVLQRLSDAVREGRTVFAVIRGSAVNQDGASNGLTAPNGPSQERVIRAALGAAALTAADVDVVEAHGTGTRLGDPIEAQAILAAYGQDREVPLRLGSVKSNLGHTQAAAGVAGVIKMVMALRHGVLPKTLHVDEPTPVVDWSAGSVALLTEALAWPETGRVRRAGVSSFGISGTNAHVILEQAPEQAVFEPPVPAAGPVPWVLSGRSAQALRDTAARLADRLAADPQLRLDEVGHALVTTRTALEHRAVVVGGDRVAMARGLARVAAGEEPSAASTRGRLAMVFSGQGSQALGMGRVLHSTQPVFTAAFDEICALADPLLGRSLRDVVFEDESRLARTGFAQPALFALEVALFRLAESWGVRPDAVAGHSVGELAAAYVAGVLELTDAVRLVVARATLMDALPDGGAMTALGVSEEEVLPLLDEGVALAAVNGPRSVVVSGDRQAVSRLAAQVADAGGKVTDLEVGHAFHSPLMDPMLADFRAVAETVAFHEPALPIVLRGDPTSPEFWVQQVRGTVRFADTVDRLIADGVTRFVELGPGGTLAAFCRETGGDAVVAVPLLRHGKDENRTVLRALADMFTAGTFVDWRTAFPTGLRPVRLPTYPFQHRHFWLPAPSLTAEPGLMGMTATAHPILRATTPLPDSDGALLTGTLSLRTQPWLADHAVAGTVILPGTAFVELAVRAGDEVGCAVLRELVVESPLRVPGHGEVAVQVAVGAQHDGQRRLTVHSRTNDGTWTRHACGYLVGGTPPNPPRPARTWPPRGAEAVDVTELYRALEQAGYAYGPAFRGVTAAWRSGEDVFAEVTLPAAARGHLGPGDGGPGTDDAEGASYLLHPALFDAALHMAALDSAAERIMLPFAWTGVAVHAAGATQVRVRVAPAAGGGLRIELTDPDGEPVATVDSLLLRPGPEPGVGDFLHRVGWQPLTAAPSDEPWVALGECDLPGAQATYNDLDDLAAAARSGAWSGTTALWQLPLDAEPTVPAATTAVVLATLDVLQRWLAETDLAPRRLVVATRRAIGDDVGEVAHSAVWGLVRTAQSEHPGQFVLLDADGSAVPAALRAALSSDEPQLVLREAVIRVPRLVTETNSAATEAPSLRGGTVLVTGGTGGLGGVVARHLVTAYGVTRLILVSRQGPAAEGADELVRELVESGARAQVIACDVADRAALTAVIAGLGADLVGVVHAAGTVDDAVIGSLPPETVAEGLRAKVTGSWLLHELTSGLDLAIFVLFSSLAGVIGSAGQGVYAAGSAFADGLADHRRAQGLPAVSLDWGLWAGSGGMGGRLAPADVTRLRRGGVLPMAAEHALALFDRGLRSGSPAVVAARLDLDALRANGASLLRRTATAAHLRPTQQARTAGGADRLRALHPDRRRRELLTLVSSHASAALGHDTAEELPPDRAFKDLGFDSLAAVELRNRLADATGLRLSTTAVFDHPTCAALADHLDTLFIGAPSEPAPLLAAAAAYDEPIGIVGLGCRFPGGVTSAEELWDLVESGTDAMSGFPTDRGWDPALSNAGFAAVGGFLHDAAGFDSDFFGISPREALAMDPQQRLMMEVTWEALERAGIAPHSLGGSRTGVFLGVMYHDYVPDTRHIPDDYVGYASSGAAGSIVSGRVAYHLGLTGPAITVDTACSSSLVALHLACESLRRGESSLALAGGVTVMASPWTFQDFARQGGLASDGRCKSFAEAADGTGWSEGAGVVVLERLSDARRNGHRMLAVVRGSAVNQDGASNGLTAPHGPSQIRVIRSALAHAGLRPSQVQVVEAHGTGTRLGDPIEAQALLATYGQGRDPEQPLLLGSVKSNIGHTQAAAGMAGVIKTVMAMRHRTVPGSLHVDTPTSAVDWTAGAVRLALTTIPWPRTEDRLLAAVSSFGVSGTNAHVILEEAPPGEEPGPAAGGSADSGEAPAPLPFALSGRSVAAVRAQAQRLVGALCADPGLALADVAYSLAATRSLLDHRKVVTATGRDRLLAELDAVAREGEATPVGRGAMALVFPGQGAQRQAMGSGLYAAYPVFAEAFDEICALFDRHLDRRLRPLVFEGAQGELGRTAYAQPALFAVEVALFRLLESWGVRPDFVAGHSVGELAAAYVAGAVGLPDAVMVVAARARLMDALPAGGAMAAVALPEADVLLLLTEEVELAAVNGPDAVVVSGAADAVAALVDTARARGARGRTLEVSHAFHSRRMEPMLREFHEVVASVAWREPAIPVAAAGDVTSPDYWVRQVREPVRFGDTVRWLAAQGVTRFAEAGPDGGLASLCAPGPADPAAEPAVALALLRRGCDEPAALLRGLGALSEAGVPVDWRSVIPGPRRQVDLPTYPFQHRHYWLSAVARPDDPVSMGLSPLAHPILGAAIGLPGTGGSVLTGVLSRRNQPWLADHVVRGVTLLPGAVFVDLAVRAGDEAGCPELAELVVESGLVVPESGDVRVQVVVGAREDGRRGVTVYARAGDEPWTRHASGALMAGPDSPRHGDEGDGWALAWPPRGARRVEAAELYQRLTTAGYEYGPAFRGVTAAWHRGPETFAEVALPEGTSAQDAGFVLHPLLLDAASQVLALHGEDGRVMLPFAWSGVSVRAVGARTARVRLSAAGGDAVRIDLADASGSPVAAVRSLVVRPQEPTPAADGLYQVQWQAVRAADTADLPTALVGDPALVPAAVGVVGYLDLEALAMAAASGVWTGRTALWPVPAGLGPQESATTALAVVQRWLTEERFAGRRLTVLTRGAVAVEPGDELPGLEHTPVWGLVRSAQTENPGRLVVLDLDGTASWDAVGTAIGSDEPQTAVRGAAVYAPRLTRLPAHAALLPPEAPGWHLEVGESGHLDRLALVADPDAAAPLGPLEIRIAMRAAGLNFRDVVTALGLIPGYRGLGHEGAGVVAETGAEVTSLAVGDRVTGMFYGSFGPFAVTDHRHVVLMPESWSFTQAASVPLVFATAYYGLVDLAGLEPGESLLVHAAAGGVGMAAVQLARHLGAEVFGTASDAKREAVAALGVRPGRIASSRTLDFEDEFRAANGGRNFDVVLNSLTGPFIEASLRLLGDGSRSGRLSRFMEMGKTDLRDAVDIARDHPGVAYHSFSTDDASSERVQEILTEVVRLFEAGVLRHLPLRTWDIRRAVDAFRYVSQAKHIGKVVLTLPPVAREGTVLVTGGTGGLGRHVARHLASAHGARRMVLLSRAGAAAPGAAELIRELAESGVAAEVVGCDVADREALGAVIDRIGGDLTGVVHAAGVVDDGVVEALTAERVRDVLRPKIDGARLLHELTEPHEPTFFVAFSSLAGVVGSAGQAAYAAANVYLDGLMETRRAAGLPGLSLAWGLWNEESGMGGRLTADDRARLGRGGVVPMATDHALALFDAALRLGQGVAVPAALDLTALRGQDNPLLRRLVIAPVARARADNEGRGPAVSRDALFAKPAAERSLALLDLVRQHAAEVLDYGSPQDVGADRGFHDLGVDSLAAVEIRNRLTAVTAVDLPATVIFDHPSPRALARYLDSRLVPADTRGGAAPLDDSAAVAALEAAFAAGDETRAAALAGRLRALLRGWDRTSAGPDIAQASADEVLRFLDRTLTDTGSEG